MALEHVLSTADNIVDDPATPFPEYAADPRGKASWRFWWDQERERLSQVGSGSPATA